MVVGMPSPKLNTGRPCWLQTSFKRLLTSCIVIGRICTEFAAVLPVNIAMTLSDPTCASSLVLAKSCHKCLSAAITQSGGAMV